MADMEINGNVVKSAKTTVPLIPKKPTLIKQDLPKIESKNFQRKNKKIDYLLKELFSKIASMNEKEKIYPTPQTIYMLLSKDKDIEQTVIEALENPLRYKMVKWNHLSKKQKNLHKFILRNHEYFAYLYELCGKNTKKYLDIAKISYSAYINIKMQRKSVVDKSILGEIYQEITKIMMGVRPRFNKKGRSKKKSGKKHLVSSVVEEIVGDTGLDPIESFIELHRDLLEAFEKMDTQDERSYEEQVYNSQLEKAAKQMGEQILRDKKTEIEPDDLIKRIKQILEKHSKKNPYYVSIISNFFGKKSFMKRYVNIKKTERNKVLIYSPFAANIYVQSLTKVGEYLGKVSDEIKKELGIEVNFDVDMTIAACDKSKLNLINHIYGTDKGDKVLAKYLKNLEFVSDYVTQKLEGKGSCVVFSKYNTGDEAILIAFGDKKKIQQYIKEAITKIKLENIADEKILFDLDDFSMTYISKTIQLNNANIDKLIKELYLKADSQGKEPLYIKGLENLYNYIDEKAVRNLKKVIDNDREKAEIKRIVFMEKGQSATVRFHLKSKELDEKRLELMKKETIKEGGKNLVNILKNRFNISTINTVFGHTEADKIRDSITYHAVDTLFEIAQEYGVIKGNFEGMNILGKFSLLEKAGIHIRQDGRSNFLILNNNAMLKKHKFFDFLKTFNYRLNKRNFKSFLDKYLTRFKDKSEKIVGPEFDVSNTKISKITDFSEIENFDKAEEKMSRNYIVLRMYEETGIKEKTLSELSDSQVINFYSNLNKIADLFIVSFRENYVKNINKEKQQRLIQLFEKYGINKKQISSMIRFERELDAVFYFESTEIKKALIKIARKHIKEFEEVLGKS